MVSVIIPVYNGVKYLRGAINSVLAQTYENREILVINDGSDDGGATAAVAKRYGRRIRYFTKENGGVASALNLGLEHMRGDYFAWLSHDDYYLPEKLAHQIAHLEALDKKTVIYGSYRMKEEPGGVRSTAPLQRMYAARQLATPLFPVFRGLVNGCTVLIHKSHFERVGSFDPSLRTTQDYDLWFRLFRQAPVSHCPHADVVVRLHPGQGTRQDPSHAAEANRLWVEMGRQITDAEKAQVAGTPYHFNRMMADYLGGRGTLDEAAAFYKREMAHARQNQNDGALAAAIAHSFDALCESLPQAARRAFTGEPAEGTMARLARSVCYDGLRATWRRGRETLG